MSNLIDRQAAIDAIEHRLAEPAYQHEGEDWYAGMNCAESELYDLPPAQSEPHWIPFVLRPATDEEKEENPDLDYYLDGKTPDDGQKILIAVRLNGHEEVQADEFCEDADGSYLDGGYEIGTEAVAWKPLPEPYKESE